MNWNNLLKAVSLFFLSDQTSCPAFYTDLTVCQLSTHSSCIHQPTQNPVQFQELLLDCTENERIDLWQGELAYNNPL